jgi:putative ATP-dependent endonuclease of the OLD family
VEWRNHRKINKWPNKKNMKLIELSIHNYRGIINQTVCINNYSLLVGANNSGKTTVIDAIRAVYEKDGFKFRPDDDLPLKGQEGEESWIDLTFSLLEHEAKSLAVTYQTVGRKLKVRKCFLTKGKSPSGSILVYNSNGKLSDKPFYGPKSGREGKLGKLIYIPAISKVEEHTKLSGSSVFRDLITNIMSDVEKSEAYDIFKNSVHHFANSIKSIKADDKRSLSDFQQELNSWIKSWQTNFKLDFTVPSTTEIIKSMLTFNIYDDSHKKAQNIDCFGSGFQRYFIYSLFMLSEKYVQRKLSKETKDFTPTLNLVLFEEPEAFLHPPQQYELFRSLIKLSKVDGWQVLCSTHSSHFVSKNADCIPDIIRMQREDGIISVFQITTTALEEILNSNIKSTDNEKLHNKIETETNKIFYLA